MPRSIAHARTNVSTNAAGPREQVGAVLHQGRIPLCEPFEQWQSVRAEIFQIGLSPYGGIGPDRRKLRSLSVGPRPAFDLMFSAKAALNIKRLSLVRRIQFERFNSHLVSNVQCMAQQLPRQSASLKLGLR